MALFAIKLFATMRGNSPRRRDAVEMPVFTNVWCQSPVGKVVLLELYNTTDELAGPSSERRLRPLVTVRSLVVYVLFTFVNAAFMVHSALQHPLQGV